MVASRRVEAAALLRPPTAKNQLPAPAVPVTVVDVSRNRIGLRLDPGTDVAPNRMVEVGIEGQWIRGRIVWSAEGVLGSVIAGVELAEAPVLPALLGPPGGPIALAC